MTQRGPIFTRFSAISAFVAVTSQPPTNIALTTAAAPNSSVTTLRSPIFSRFNPADSLHNLSTQQRNELALTVVYPATFGLFDWPVPKGAVGSADLRTWLQSLSLPQASAKALTPFDYPNPRGPIGSIDLRTWAPPISLALKVAPIVYPATFGQHDWPLPAAPLGALRQAFLWQWSYPPALIPPAPPAVLTGYRCIYTFSANWAQRPQLRQDRGFYVRYIKQTDSPTWAASFYDHLGRIISTPLTVTLTVNYETRNGPATDVLPMKQHGIFWKAQWESAAITLGRSIATWTISAPSLNVVTNGFFQVFSNFPQS